MKTFVPMTPFLYKVLYSNKFVRTSRKPLQQLSGKRASEDPRSSLVGHEGVAAVVVEVVAIVVVVEVVAIVVAVVGEGVAEARYTKYISSKLRC